MSSQKPSVQAGRRRPGSPTPSGERERAEAPVRRREGGSEGGRPTGPVFSGGKLPRSPLGIGLLVLIVICVVIVYMFSGGDDQPTEPESAADFGEPTLPAISLPTDTLAVPTRPAVAERTPTRRPTQAPAQATTGDSWLVLLYQDADDKVLEQDIFVDLNEAERVGSGAGLTILAQIDRYQAGYTGSENWTGTRRYLVRQDDDLNRIGSDLVQDLGEANMADGKTLVDFVIWGIENYPADKVALILSDHGMGWPGGWSDPTARQQGGVTPIENALGDYLFLNEIDEALGTIRQQSGLEQFELIGMDACLMGHIEVMSALASHARYAVLSQEVEPSLGWAYTAFLDELSKNPGMDGAQLGALIVDSYIVDDQRIIDDNARRELVGRGQPLSSLFGETRVPSAAQLADQFGQNITLTAVDLQVLPELNDKLNGLALALQEISQRSVAQARSYAQSFTSIFGKDVPPAYIDLGNFADLLGRETRNSAITQVVTELKAAIQQAVLAEKHGKRIAAASGVSIYFPNSKLYQSQVAGPESYTGVAERFAGESLWDDFLVYHYTGQEFDAGTARVAVPSAGTALRAPAAGGIQVSDITASATQVSPGGTVRLTVDIDGENIGYIKLLVGYLDRAANSLYLADSDFLASPEARQVNGVYYPVWGDQGVSLSFDWEPIVYAIDDGTTRFPALFSPEVYGASSEEAVYTVEGIYTFADSGDQLNARLYFVNGTLQQVYSFSEDDATGAPHEILPQPGDTFTILEKWMDLDAQGNVVENVRQEGETLTFSDRMFTWEVLDAAAGQYVVGFIIEDLDGNAQVVYTPIVVR